MDSVITVAIGIQARLHSERLPKKVFEYIGNKRMIEHVIDNCNCSKMHINKQTWRHSVNVELALLVPTKEEKEFSKIDQIPILTGPEDDVLTRYNRLLHFNPNFIVRITSDCPFIPPELITKHIMTATKHRLDFVSNVDERFRTSPDGYDVEIMSKDMFDYALNNAVTTDDREHVTSIIKRSPPPWARVAHIMHNIDENHNKYSVDTREDLEYAKKLHKQKTDKLRALKFTKDGIFNF